MLFFMNNNSIVRVEPTSQLKFGIIDYDQEDIFYIKP